MREALRASPDEGGTQRFVSEGGTQTREKPPEALRGSSRGTRRFVKRHSEVRQRLQEGGFQVRQPPPSPAPS